MALSIPDNYLWIIGYTDSEVTNIPSLDSIWKFAYVVVKRRYNKLHTYTWVELNGHNSDKKAYIFYDSDIGEWSGWVVK